MTAAILGGALTLACLLLAAALSLHDRHTHRQKRLRERRERILSERLKRDQADDAYRQALAGAQRIASLPRRRA